MVANHPTKRFDYGAILVVVVLIFSPCAYQDVTLLNQSVASLVRSNADHLLWLVGLDRDDVWLLFSLLAIHVLVVDVSQDLVPFRVF